MKKLEKEIRQAITKLKIRAMEDEETEIVEGYALKFDRWSDNLGWFREKLAPDCLKNTNMDNVVALFNHDQSNILGRTGINLDLAVDNIGLKFRLKPTGTTIAKDLLENIRSGIVNQCSFAFTVPNEEGAEEWRYDKENDFYERTINKIDRLYDVSVVTTPAYPDTEVVVGARGLEMVEDLKEAPKKQEARQLLAELDKEILLASLDD